MKTMRHQISNTNPPGGEMIPSNNKMDTAKTTDKPSGSQPAHPVPVSYINQGISVRDWIAGMALSALPLNSFSSAEHYAARAYEIADAMIKAGEQSATGKTETNV